ncbi:hypothetical protein GAY28_05290 [Azospirillum brasilense]|nr:hypothetical protein [Azospirillum brasilense]
MLIEEIDEFLTRPLLHVAWNEEPYDTGDNYRQRVKRWAVHENGIDTGVVLAATYPPIGWRQEFRLELKRKYAFARLDMRDDQRAIAIARTVPAGPIHFPGQANREGWLKDSGKFGRLTVHAPAPTGHVSFHAALDWFLKQYGIEARDVPARLKLGR